MYVRISSVTRYVWDPNKALSNGPTLSADLLAVVFVDIEDDVVRIISARRMTRAERERFFREDYQ